MKVTIAKKITAGFLLIIVISVIFASAVLKGINAVNNRVDAVVKQYWLVSDAVKEIHICFLEKSHVHSMILEGRIGEAKKYWGHADKEFINQLSRLKNSTLSFSGIITQLESINNEFNITKTRLISAYEQAESGAQGGVLRDGTEAPIQVQALRTSAAMREVNKIIETMHPLFIQLEKTITSEKLAAVKQSYQDVINAKMSLVVFTVVIFLLAIGLSIIITRNITTPVTSLVSMTDAVAKGDLTGVIISKSADEIGMLAKSFGLMLKNLREILTKTQGAATQIATSSNQILAASQQQAAGAREQSAAVSETTAASKELLKSAEQVGESVNRVSQVATHAMAGMGDIKNIIDKTGQIITSLSEKSQKISKITELIDDVADQTNLLAVNASIEAARAGEEGRGFTVVADEIRKLADSTTKSTKDITALIEIIQHEMSNAIMAMEETVNSVNQEMALSQESADRAKEIAMSATQQIRGSEQIVDAMANIDEAMKQIAAGAYQTQDAVKQLTELGQELKETTGKFKLD
ncbi:MAG: HAMP domain-containing methyl-accepting chemotaxis protein [Candidatus Omnitrophota bacterium]